MSLLDLINLFGPILAAIAVALVIVAAASEIYFRIKRRHIEKVMRMAEKEEA
jgi:hypothetical protein